MLSDLDDYPIQQTTEPTTGARVSMDALEALVISPNAPFGFDSLFDGAR